MNTIANERVTANATNRFITQETEIGVYKKQKTGRSQKTIFSLLLPDLWRLVCRRVRNPDVNLNHGKIQRQNHTLRLKMSPRVLDLQSPSEMSRCQFIKESYLAS